MSTISVAERLEDLRAQLCGISGQAHKLNCEIEGIQNLILQFPNRGTDLAITLKCKMSALILLVDALALSTLQLEHYIRWSGEILAGMAASDAIGRKPSPGEVGSLRSRKLHG
jgi:hypothetical protein